MNFIKKNYEKILLGAVLLGLFGAVLSLPVVIAADKAELNKTISGITETQPKPLSALDMSGEGAALTRVQAPYDLDFENTNRLFNPLRWQKRPDGGIFPIQTGSDVGAGAVKVMAIKPLYFNLKLTSIEPANQFSAARYVISMQEQNAPISSQRNPHDTYISVGEKNNTFSLVSANGATDNPQLILQMIGSGDTVTLTKSQPYQRVDGYMADLTYPLLGKKWNNVRVEDPLKNINGDDYIVVVIDENEVVLSAESNQKKTTLKYQP